MTQFAACLGRHLSHVRESRSDGELLAAFLSEHDNEAFAELVRRHGSLVWATCRRLLPDTSDAEDAFQSSFLVLVRRGRRLRSRDTLGPWLYQVAVRTARNIRRRNARIMAKRKPLGDSAAAPTSTELRTDIDDALAALPEKYRTPLVLCHLQGWSRRDAAERLGCPEGTLSSLLARGLDRLRTKLSGFDPAKALTIAAPAVPMLLASSTVKAAAGMKLAAAGAVSATVHQLVEGVVHMFWIKKATAASFALVAIFSMGIGVGVSVKQVPGASAGDGPAAIVSDDLTQFKVQHDTDARALAEALAQVQSTEEAAAQAKKAGQAEKLAQLLRELAVAQDAAEQAKLRMAIRKATPAGAAEELTRQKKQLADLQSRVQNLDDSLRALRDRVAAAKAKGDAELERRTLRETEGVQVERDAIAREYLQLAAKFERLDTLKFDDQTREQRDLLEQIEKLRSEQEALHAQSLMLAMKREAAQRELALLEAKRTAGNKTLSAATPAAEGILELTIASATAQAPFKVMEIVKGQPVGTLTFDNITILTRYLARTGKDPKAPKTVKLTVQADTKFEVIKQIVEACAAAGLTPPATLNLGKQKINAKSDDDLAREIEAYYKAGNR
jgi:RNA polymerase sigma factor (sigma-70 family)